MEERPLTDRHLESSGGIGGLEARNHWWHSEPIENIFAQFGSGPHGLNEAEVQERLRSHGPNRLPASSGRSVLRRLADQFNNLLIYVLLAAALLAFLVDHKVDSSVILAVVLVNGAIGFIQEGKAERALEAIREMLDPQASVLRNGARRTVRAEDVVPGDVVLIGAGDRVPADVRLIRAQNLRIEEAVLTGESVASDKAVAPVPAATPLGSRASMAFSGTVVVAGQGAGIAVATGPATELGQISRMVASVERLQTPLLRQVERFGRQLTAVILLVSILTFLFAFYLRAYEVGDAVMVVIGLAVAAIPEGLPAIMTVALAIGVQQMAQRNAIIRRLPAVETLGSVSVICTDKTGTLTRNEMTVRTVQTVHGAIEVTGVGYGPEGDVKGTVPRRLIEAAVLCNDAELRLDDTWHVEGDPMEGSLLTLASKAGADPAQIRSAMPRLAEIPFDAAHRYMATLHSGAERLAFIKGAPERIFEMCDTVATTEGERPIDRAAWMNNANELAARGERLLAFAVKRLDADTASVDFADLDNGAVLLGVIGFIDPPRPDAVTAVRECREAGIRIIMITGDHSLTAREIARQLAIAAEPKVLTGAEIDHLDEQELRAAALETSVFARTTPEHKLRLVCALQSDGLRVAMTGDGVNDAPALKRADIGIAMGIKGTEASKQAAEMVLADDNFTSIAAAVREGRRIYDNLRKMIAWTLPTNGGEAFTILLALALGLSLPVTPVQILWINMITAVALGLTLAFEPAEPDIMRRPPRLAFESLIGGRTLWRIVFVSVLMVAGAFGTYAWALGRGLDVATARTMVVNAIVAMEIFYLFSIRYQRGPSITLHGVLGTSAVLLGVLFVTTAQFLFTYWTPLAQVFGARPVALLDGLFVVAVGVTLMIAVEVEKWAMRRFWPNGGSGFSGAASDALPGTGAAA
jgi:calcium-translocating P-type ATPase